MRLSVRHGQALQIMVLGSLLTFVLLYIVEAHRAHKQQERLLTDIRLRVCGLEISAEATLPPNDQFDNAVPMSRSAP